VKMSASVAIVASPCSGIETLTGRLTANGVGPPGRHRHRCSVGCPLPFGGSLPPARADRRRQSDGCL